MPLSLSLLLALYYFLTLFLFLFFMVLVVTSVGPWLKRKHTKTRLRREKFVGLCFCVSVYDLTRVYGFDFLGLRNRYPCVFFFLLIKYIWCFCEEEKKEKE